MYNPITPGKVLGASVVAGTGIAMLPQTSANSFLAYITPTNIAIVLLAALIVWAGVYMIIAKRK